MDYNIFVGDALSPREKLVSKTDTPRSLLGATGNKQVMLNGRVLNQTELGSTLESLGVTEGSHLLTSSKQESGHKGF